jgi:hypothetical protein
MNARVAFLFPIIMFFCFFVSCKDDDLQEGLSVEIQNIVPDSLLHEIIGLGMPIYPGFTPPTVENIYQASPFVLDTSNIPTDEPGFLYTDLNVQFTEQVSSNNSLKVSFVNGPEVGNNIDALISGEGNNFSVFLKVNSLSGTSKAELIQIFSGSITPNGIQNFYYAVFMLNNFGNEKGYWIENGQGRIIYDSDGESPIVETLYSRKQNNEAVSAHLWQKTIIK